MIAADVNVFVDANRPTSPNHEVAKAWLERALVAEEPFALWDVSLISVYRLLTDARIWVVPETPQSALDYLNRIRAAPASVRISPGTTFWTIFEGLVLEADVRGKLTSDAMLAALAVEHRCRLATFDKDFSKIKGLQSFRPTP